MKNISFSIKISLEKALSGLKNLQSAVKSVEDEFEKTSSTTQRFSGICSKLNFPNIAAIASVARNVGDSFSQAGNTGMTFGQRMSDLSAITGIVGDDLKQLEENARRFGKESGLGADTAARAYTVLASQIQVADIGMEGLNKLQEKSITLAQASGMTLDAAAESLAGTINQFGLSADEANRVINVLAAGSKYGAAEISELSQSFKVVGAAASAMGLDVESTAGALEVLSKANLKGAEAGTALRNIILKLNTTLGIDLGETSLSTALDALKPKLNDATYLSKLFGAENIAAAQFLIQNAAAVDEMTRQLTGTNVAEEQAAIRTQTTAQRMAELRAQMDDIKISITNATGSFGPLMMIVSENAEAITLASSAFGFLMSKVGVLNQAVVKLTGSTIMQNAASMAASAAAKTWAGVQAALNAVMSANPISMVVIAIGGLVAAIIACYNHFEGFREVCDKVWDAIKEMASAVWNHLVTAFERASKVVREAWQWIKNFFGIKDEQSAEQAAQSIDKETQAIERNTNAKKKNAALILNFGGTDNTNKSGTVTEKVELNGLDETAIRKKIQVLQDKMDAAPTLEAKASIVPEINQLEGMLGQIQKTVENHKFQLRFEASEVGKLNLEGEKIAPSVTIETGRITQMAEEAKGQMQDIFNKPLKVKVNDNDMKGFDERTRSAYESVGQLGSSLAQLGSSIGLPALDIMGVIAQSIANVALSYSQALAGAASMGPWAWIAFAATGLAQMVAVIGSIKQATAFAAGGIVSGPTYALVGEYAGASNNPEVIAPLDKLRTLINTDQGGQSAGGRVTFRLQGRELLGLMEREGEVRRRR